MAVRQHKFIDTTNNEEVYHIIFYTDESEYDGKVLEVIETVKDLANNLLPEWRKLKKIKKLKGNRNEKRNDFFNCCSNAEHGWSKFGGTRRC